MGKAVITISVGTTFRDAEKAIIEATLQHTGGNISVAARILGVDRPTLYKKIAKYKIRCISVAGTIVNGGGGAVELGGS